MVFSLITIDNKKLYMIFFKTIIFGIALFAHFQLICTTGPTVPGIYLGNYPIIKIKQLSGVLEGLPMGRHQEAITSLTLGDTAYQPSSKLVSGCTTFRQLLNDTSASKLNWSH